MTVSHIITNKKVSTRYSVCTKDVIVVGYFGREELTSCPELNSEELVIDHEAVKWIKM